jgi:CHAT domain-containing protein
MMNRQRCMRTLTCWAGAFAALFGLWAGQGIVRGQTKKEQPKQLSDAEVVRLAEWLGQLSKEADRLFREGKAAEAAARWRRVLDIFRQIVPKDRLTNGDPLLAHIIHNVAVVHVHAGQYGQAEPLFKEALQMNRTLYPKKDFPNGRPELARSICGLGWLYHCRGEYRRAQPLLREALEMYRALFAKERFPNGEPELAACLDVLASAYQFAGEYAQAEPLFKESLAMRRALYPKKDFPNGQPELAVSINNLALLYQSMGQYGRAQPLSKEALEMKRALFPKKHFPNGHAELATSIDNLAVLYDKTGERARAESLYKEALQMRRALYPKEKYPNGHDAVALSLNNLATSYYSQGEYTQAEPLYKEALAIFRGLYPKKSYPNGHPHVALGLRNLVQLYFSQGEYLRAVPCCKEALEMDRSLYPKEKFPNGHPDLVPTLVYLATLYHFVGADTHAETLFKEALQTCRTLYPTAHFPNGHPELAVSIMHLGALYFVSGQYGRAEPLLKERLEMYLRLADAYLSTASEAESMNFLATQPRARDDFLSTTRRLPPDPAGYDTLWQGRAPLYRLLQRRRLDLAAARDPKAEDLYARLATARRHLSSALLSDKGASAERLAELTAVKEELEKKLAAQLGLKPQPPLERSRPAVVAEALDAASAFIDFVRYMDVERDPRKPGKAGVRDRQRYVAFVLAGGQQPVRVELGEAGPIEQAWAAWRTAIVARQPDRAEAAAVAKLVWDPLRSHLPAGLKTVWLCPDGALCQVPWAALPGSKAGTVLAEDHAVAVVPHGPYLADGLRAGSSASPKKSGVLAVGGVDYDGDPAGTPDAAVASLRGPAGESRKGLQYLPGTLAEMRRIAAEARASLKADPVTRSGKEASVASLLADLPQARYAHLATHGFFADAHIRSVLQVDEKRFQMHGLERAAPGARSPLVLSGLVLAGANRRDAGSDRGILTAEGIIGLNLEGMDLAVLSACDTGLGEVAGGEGVLGLVRAFHVAGARNVVASLWQVSDESTAALMGRFYHKLWAEKLPPLEALRQAQLDVYRNPDRISEWAKREFDLKEKPLPPQAAAAGKGERARTAQWAAFLLSGAGR